MSRLTREQKTANKAAQKIRDRAYAARRRLYRAACDAAEKAAEQSIFAKNRDSAVEAMEQEWQNRNAACEAIESEIQALKEKLDRTKAQFSTAFEPKRQSRNDAQKAFQEHRAALLAEVEASFPDMLNCWSVSAWDIPAEVRAEMDAAAKGTVTA
ncbi:hypothetical protein QYH69_34060 [Paraburkholderia sp. SARCC-3016]|uniref:hypothetical protein n=1 Tax=Paraburkholderia sp. SARCC-3016 TaxID=3058611 RepID=UPI0028083474|nr:hypothetical protein [Paraburkholderia sp. SARCC-3016]MDQ7982251.1 hypothetical protein [Paraburkholderia sp. SARCC-3016]